MLALALWAVGAAALAQTGSSEGQGAGTLPNRSRAVPGTVPTPSSPSDIPAGTNTGTPAASPSVPLGTPAAPPVLVAPGTGATRGGTASTTPAATSQNPPSRSLPHDAAGGIVDPAAAARGAEAGGADRATHRRSTRAMRSSSGRDTHTGRASSTDSAMNAGFPPGMADCAALADRDARARCASDLYGGGEPPR